MARLVWFVAETVDAVQCLVEELHIDLRVQNDDGMDALEKFESEHEFPQVAEYLRTRMPQISTAGSASVCPGPVPNGGQIPASLPPNVSMTIGTSSSDAALGTLDQVPDPEFSRRIEELADSENFHTVEGQRELRDLITDAIRDVEGDGREVRRRVG